MANLVPNREAKRRRHLVSLRVAGAKAVLLPLAMIAGLVLIAFGSMMLGIHAALVVLAPLPLLAFFALFESRAGRRLLDPAFLTGLDAVGLEWVEATERGDIDRARVLMAELEATLVDKPAGLRATVGDLVFQVSARLMSPGAGVGLNLASLPVETPTPGCPSSTWLALCGALRALNGPTPRPEQVKEATRELIRCGLTDRFPFISWIVTTRLHVAADRTVAPVIPAFLTIEQRAAAKRLFPAAEEAPELGPYRTGMSTLASPQSWIHRPPDWDQLERLLAPDGLNSFKWIVGLQGLFLLLTAAETRTPVVAVVAGAVASVLGLGAPLRRGWRIVRAFSKTSKGTDGLTLLRLVRAVLRPRTLRERLRVARVGLAAAALEEAVGSNEELEARERLQLELEAADPQTLAALRLRGVRESSDSGGNQ